MTDKGREVINRINEKLVQNARAVRQYYSCDECGYEWFGFKVCPSCGGCRVGIEKDPVDEMRELR